MCNVTKDYQVSFCKKIASNEKKPLSKGGWGGGGISLILHKGKSFYQLTRDLSTAISLKNIKTLG